MTSATSAQRTVSVSGLPLWYTSAAEASWINVRTAASQPIGTQLRENVSGNIVSVSGNWQVIPSDEHIIGVWCGGAVLDDYYALVAQGGHAKTSDNGVYVFGPFSSETPGWSRVFVSDENATNANDDAYYPATGRPASRHGYHHGCCVPAGNGRINEWVTSHVGAPYPGGGEAAGTQSYRFPTPPNLATSSLVGGTGNGSYDIAGYNQDWPPGTMAGAIEMGVTAWDPTSERVYVFGANNGYGDLWEFAPLTRQWTSTPYSGSWAPCKAGAIDYDNYLAVGYVASTGREIIVVDLHPNNKGDVFTISVGGADPESGNTNDPNGRARPGMCYVPNGQKIVVWDGPPALYTLEIPSGYRNGTNDPAEPITNTAGWEWQLIPGIDGTALPNVFGQGTSWGGDSGIFNKFGYVQSIGAICQQSWMEDDMYVWKVPAAGI